MGDETTCPSCGTAALAPTGEPESCPECGQWWVPSEDAHLSRTGPHELEIQNAPGDAVRGPFDRLDLRERLYRGLLTGEELVRPVGGRFRALRSIPDFSAILQLRERGKPRPVVTRRAIKERADAKPTPSASAIPAPAAGGTAPGAPGPEAAATEAAPRIEAPPPRRVLQLVGVTTLVGTVVLLVAMLAYSMLL